MASGYWPGFVIDNTTIAVDYWPKKPQLNVTHSFLTHCHSDHTKNLDKNWNGSVIYCSKITKKLLIDLKQIKPHFIHELEMNQTHIMWVGDSTFNVTLLDANHCLGAVMYLFESDLFGLILATGDFRYTPDMFSPGSLLVNKEIEMCYLDNTYFDKAAYSNIPTRKDAYEQIKQLIEIKRKSLLKELSNTTIIFKIILKTLGKEELLMELAEDFKTKIVCSKIRYNRYVNVLELDKKYFSSKFESDSFIFVQDNDNETIDQIEGLNSTPKKHFIMIEPSALLSDPNRPTQTRKLAEYFSKSTDSYFRVPYTDHSSYLEIIEFVRKLKPKRVLPIVRQLMPNNVKTDDLSYLARYLNFKPLKDTKNCYRYLLETKGTRPLSSPNVTKSNIPCRKSNIPSRKSTFRYSTKKKQGVEYESSDEELAESNNNAEEKGINADLKLRNGGATNRRSSSDKENKEKSSGPVWEKIGELVDIRAASFSQSEHDISSKNLSLNTNITPICNKIATNDTTPIGDTTTFNEIITRSKSPKKLNEINISNQNNSSSKTTPIHSKIIVQSVAQKLRNSNSPSKMALRKENLNDEQSPSKSKQLDLQLLPAPSITSTNSSVITYKTPLKKVISSYYESCESQKENAESQKEKIGPQKENAESPVFSLKNKSPSLCLNLSESTNGRDKKSMSPQKKESEFKEFLEPELDIATNNESGYKRPVTESLESILIEHTESDQISYEEKNQAASEKLPSKIIEDTFESTEENSEASILKKKVTHNEISIEPVDEFTEFYTFFENRIAEKSQISEQSDMNVFKSCSQLMHEWVLGSFDF